MATFKIIVFHNQKRKDGKCPVRIRVTWKRKQDYISTEYYVTEKQYSLRQYIDDKGKQRADIILKDNFIFKQLLNRIAEYEKLKSEKLGHKIYSYNVKELCSYFENNTGVKKYEDIDFISFCQDLIDDVLIKKNTTEISEGTAKLYQTAVNSLKKFAGSKIYASEINSNFLELYTKHLREKESDRGSNRAKPTSKKSKLTETGINLYIRTVRALFNKAKLKFNDEDKEDILIRNEPFKKYKVPKAPITKKRSLEIDQIKTIRDIDVKLDREILARDVFMLSFYLLGTNTVDLYNCKKYSKGRLSYDRTKTKNRREDNAHISIKIEPEALKIIEKYKSTTEYVFRFKEMYADSISFNKAVNKGLKKIGEKIGLPELQFYSARHSWATLALNKCEIGKYEVHEYLNHTSEGKMKVTDIYIKKDWGPQDRANRKVLDLLI